MKKVEIITLHRVPNYGSFLQAYATQQKVCELGYETEIIDYIPERMTKNGMLKALKNKKNILKKSLLVRTIAQMIIYPSYILRFKIFDRAINKYLNITNFKYSSEEQLEKNVPNADIFMTGSDQTWNSGWNGGIDYPLFLKFINGKPKVAYAASFGKSKLDEWEKEITKDLLNDYEAISLREESGVMICDELGIINTISVLDPTLLLDGNAWRKISTNKHCNENYILVYNLNRNKKIDKYAKNLSKKTGLKIKYLSYQLHEFYKAGKMYCNPEIEEFLDLIDNAKYIISDSFHATAFSLNFNKEFIIVYPGKYSTRLQNVLKLLGLENRVAKDENDLSIIEEKINYEKVNQIVEKKREESIKWLKDSLV